MVLEENIILKDQLRQDPNNEKLDFESGHMGHDVKIRHFF